MSDTEPSRSRGTRTSNFGVGVRESHDASGFYARFTAPVISDDHAIEPQVETNSIWLGDARDMDRHGKIADASVALAVTSPPYFAGKAYEEDLGADGVPSNYAEYLELLTAVFAECARKLEPGGRLAVNVANLGRKPYRSLSSDVVAIFERLGLLLRGEIIWRKAEAPGGNCAWGTFQRPGNPVLRDTTERILVASKGRFDRAIVARDRAEQGLPSIGSIRADEFLEATSDVWDIAPESARRVGHPAPFPVELPRRLIELYTYVDDLVLDPFMGAGSTAVAAATTGRNYVGFDLDPAYIELATTRVDDAMAAAVDEHADSIADTPIRLPAVTKYKVPVPDDLTEAIAMGLKARDLAEALVDRAGFTERRAKPRIAGTEITFQALDADGNPVFFEVVGGFTSIRPGMQRTDLLWKALAKGLMIHGHTPTARFVLLTTHLPRKGTPGAKAVAGALSTAAVAGVIDLFDPAHHNALEALRHP